MDLKKMSVKELKDTFKSYYASVYIDECYSVKDMMILDAVAGELENRGYEIVGTVPEIVKAEV